MLEFHLADMSCGHCVRAVTEAVHQVDPLAGVTIDLPTRQVQVQSQVARDKIASVLTEAGYPPSP